jgi:AraC-like DNA-binding protein
LTAAQIEAEVHFSIPMSASGSLRREFTLTNIPSHSIDLGASRRTLENAFTEAFEVLPYEYVRAVRLDAIRRELLSEENAHVSIGDIAARWGIWHTSRFAADYRKMFGQLPSQERVLFWNSQEVVGDSRAFVVPSECWRR